MLAADFVALTVCLYLASARPEAVLDATGWGTQALLAVFTLPILSACGLYTQLVRFVDARFLRAAALGAAAFGIEALLVSYAAADLVSLRSRIPVLVPSVFCYLVLSRFGAGKYLRVMGSRQPRRMRVAIYGAGRAGFELVTAMRASEVYRPIAFIDDNGELYRRSLAGLRILALSQFLSLRADLGVEQVILAMPSAPAERLREIYRLLNGVSMPVRTLPTLAEAANAPVSPQSVREVALEDLLGRRPIAPRQDLFARCVAAKGVLVTGAGGSIGSELCRQILGLSPSVLVLLDHSEYALYEIERELRNRWPDQRIVTVLGSACVQSLVEQILTEHRIDTVYHAAAYKHVPMVEANIAQGIRNNVHSAWVVAQAAARCGVATCVLVSTDKAVRPTNVMGASKRASELVFQAMAAQPGMKTVFSMVRFGNVLGSSGSVVPLFREQLRRGGPLTVTHPDVTRYFMLIPEAAQLVIQAGAMASGGDVFVLDMGEPVRVLDLARTMIQLSGMTVRGAPRASGGIEIRITGLRQGEKLYEELLIGESAEPSEHPRILCSHEHFLPLDVLRGRLRTLMAACEGASTLAMLQALQALVDEFTPYSPFLAASRHEPAATVRSAGAPAVSPAPLLQRLEASS
ncbi:polysaccharide biosynthesis protein [Bordetella ansorpii]|nr:nucleoside-diphosphate sugar epimerase/dehydratase [Bordetella ansorpii]